MRCSKEVTRACLQQGSIHQTEKARRNLDCILAGLITVQSPCEPLRLPSNGQSGNGTVNYRTVPGSAGFGRLDHYRPGRASPADVGWVGHAGRLLALPDHFHFALLIHNGSIPNL